MPDAARRPPARAGGHRPRAHRAAAPRARGPGSTCSPARPAPARASLIDALGLALGARADTALVRHGAERRPGRGAVRPVAGAADLRPRGGGRRPVDGPPRRRDGHRGAAGRDRRRRWSRSTASTTSSGCSTSAPSATCSTPSAASGRPWSRGRRRRALARQSGGARAADRRSPRARPPDRAGRARGGRDRRRPPADRRGRRDPGAARRRRSTPRRSRGAVQRSATPSLADEGGARERIGGAAQPARPTWRGSTRASSHSPVGCVASRQSSTTSPPRSARSPRTSTTIRRRARPARGAAVGDLRPGAPLRRRRGGRHRPRRGDGGRGRAIARHGG